MKKRLNKYLSEIGYCSRREADRLITAGRVLVNNQQPELGQQVDSNDEVKVDNVVVNKDTNFVYLAFNKPVGITSTTDQSDPTNIVDYIGYKERIFHIGRLDKDSDGLIFMTNDGDIVNKILRSGNKHEKEYIVTVHKKITSDFIYHMSNGVPIMGKTTKKCFISRMNDYMFKIILTEGMNRQIRRMCSHFGYQVKQLTRTRIMNVTLSGLKTGEWRYLTEQEINDIKRLTEHSSKTEEASV